MNIPNLANQFLRLLKIILKKCPFFNYRGLESSDLARRASPFAPFSAFRPVAKIGDILQLNQDLPNIQDSSLILLRNFSDYWKQF